MPSHRTLGLRPHAARDGQRVANADANDLEHLLDRFDVALDGGLDGLGCRRNIAHLQCAGKGAEQSSTDGSNNMVQGRGHFLFGFDPVKVLDASVHAETDGRIEPFQERLAEWSLHPLDSQPTRMNDISHCSLPFHGG